MKKTLLLLSVILFSPGVYSQTRHEAKRATVKPATDIAVPKPVPSDIIPVYHKEVTIPTGKTKGYPNEDLIGTSYYDLQTNASMQNRIYAYPDGTIGATWTMSQLTSHADRGTGYNYFDGTGWGSGPTTRIESLKTGWPCYAPLGAAGEMVMSHDFTPTTGSLVMLTRATKGSGTWNQSLFPGPTGHQDLAWNRTVTAGPDHNTIHVMALTKPIGANGTAFQGLNGALVYSRSDDGGANWAVSNTVLPGMTSADYKGFSGDSYTWAAPMGDTIAFVAGDNWYDLFLMKSTDGGTNWIKTVIWEHPYPLYDLENLYVTDTFYCPDGSISAAFDSDGKVHIAFGIQRTYCDTASTGQLGTFWFPYVDGVAYWDENMGPFTSDDTMNTLLPSRLDSLGFLLGFTPDLNGNDTLDFVIPPAGEFAIGSYYLSMSSMPALHIDDNNDMYLFWAAPNEERDNTFKNFRNIWLRHSSDMGASWSDLLNINGSIVHNYDECVYPSVAPISGNTMHLVYQADDEPGTSIQGDPAHVTVENRITYSAVTKLWLAVPERPSLQFSVSQPYPNPSNGQFEMSISLNRATTVELRIFDISGQLVMNVPQGKLNTGEHKLSLNAANLKAGIYFSTIYAGDQSTTRKLIIR